MNHSRKVGLDIGSPQEFFRTKLKEAASITKISLREWTEYYLVDLLWRRVQILPIDTPLAIQLKEIVESDDPKVKLDLYRALGDSAVVLLGMFYPIVKARSVSPSYIKDMGRGAYRAAISIGADSFQVAYSDLFYRFDSFTTLLGMFKKLSSDDFQVVTKGSDK